MSFEGKKDNERVETENVDASNVGDMNEIMEGIDHDDDADEADDDVDEVDETRSYNDAHDASIALDEDDDITVKTNGDDSSQGGEEDLDEEDDDDEDDVEGTPRSHQVDTTPKSKPNKAAQTLSGNKKGRAPSVSGLSIPFRTIKKAMKLDPDTPIVQNEAAVMLTYASELFLKNLANQSFKNAKNKARHTVRYEDIAEARTNDPALAFLEMLLP